MEINKIKVEGREYNFSEDDYLIKNLVSQGLLKKVGDNYIWTKKSFNNSIKEAKHIRRYIRSSLYRNMYKSWNFLKDTFK